MPRCSTVHDSMRQSRSGVTLLEVVVVIAILGVLAAVLLPAIQQARAMSRRASCLNNFRQLGIALNSMAEVKGEFSTGGFDDPQKPFESFYPHLEQTPLLRELQDQGSARIPPVLVCPSETMQDDLFGVVPNYFLNAGTRFRDHRPSNGFESIGEGNRRASEISDGLSNTVAMSERLTAWPIGRRASMAESELKAEPRRTFWFTATRYGGRGEEHLAIDECTHRRTTPVPQFYGLGTLNHRHIRGYDHMLPPNSPGCYNGPEDFNINEGVFLIPATSFHSGGVNVLFADGSARFASESVSTEIWHAIGTRNGNETLNLEF